MRHSSKNIFTTEQSKRKDMDNDVQDDWICRFCTRIGNELFCEVERDFARDFSNLVGLNEEVTFFEKALETILDKPHAGEDGVYRSTRQPTALQDKTKEKSAENLYGLIHARYIITDKGCRKMLCKYIQGHFGRCPRVLCGDANVLPIGLSDRLGVDTVKVFCPRCNEIYSPRLMKHCYIDGAYFGTSFPHMLFMMFPDRRPPPNTEQFVPRLFGFKIHSSAYRHTGLENGRTQTRRVPKKPTTSEVNTNGVITTRTKITYT